MEGSISGFPGMIVLNSHNYYDWKIKMQDLIIVRDLYEPIDRANIPTGVIESEWKNPKQKGCGNHKIVCRHKYPTTCSKRYKCPRVVE